jgi:hypothetical protein
MKILAEDCSRIKWTRIVEEVQCVLDHGNIYDDFSAAMFVGTKIIVYKLIAGRTGQRHPFLRSAPA